MSVDDDEEFEQQPADAEADASAAAEDAAEEGNPITEAGAVSNPPVPDQNIIDGTLMRYRSATIGWCDVEVVESFLDDEGTFYNVRLPDGGEKMVTPDTLYQHDSNDKPDTQAAPQQNESDDLTIKLPIRITDSDQRPEALKFLYPNEPFLAPIDSEVLKERGQIPARGRRMQLTDATVNMFSAELKPWMAREEKAALVSDLTNHEKSLLLAEQRDDGLPRLCLADKKIVWDTMSAEGQSDLIKNDLLSEAEIGAMQRHQFKSPEEVMRANGETPEMMAHVKAHWKERDYDTSVDLKGESWLQEDLKGRDKYVWVVSIIALAIKIIPLVIPLFFSVLLGMFFPYVYMRSHRAPVDYVRRGCRL